MVQGLTTFITRRKDLYMKNYDLPHNSILVIDGDSVAINIYIQIENKNTCFGGDYDKYAIAVQNFLVMLSDCQVTPYVLFDGATEPRKVDTAVKRHKGRIDKSLKLNCLNESEIQLYPACIKEVFKGILKKMKVAIVTCDFECDQEVASIAKQLNCPVLSYDSDYYIFDVEYIPFMLEGNNQNFHIVQKVIKNEVNNKKELQKYLRCQVFNRKQFLKRTRLTQDKLPILTVYLGNDAIDRVTDVQHFIKYLKLKKGNFVQIIINFLADNDVSEAIEKMLDYYEDESEKTRMNLLIWETVDDYDCIDSKYLRYIQMDDVSQNIIENDEIKTVSKIFLDKYRRGFYHHSCLDIAVLHKYYLKPIVESVEKPHSCTSSFPIISAIHKILTNTSTKDCIFYGRVGTDVTEQLIPKCEKNVPNFDELQIIDTESKLFFFFSVINVDQDFIPNCLEIFPKSWHILLITLKYLSTVSVLEWPFIYSLLLSKIIISYVDIKIGRIRSWEGINKCASSYIGKSNTKFKPKQFTHVSQAIEEFEVEDCFKVLEVLLPFFDLSTEMKCDETFFDRNLVHPMSEFLTCFLHIDLLNDLFDMPFEKCYIWECYNGTLVYNLFSHHQKELDFMNLLQVTPSILSCFNYICNILKNNIKIA